eukprot:TRINITY_DN8064_c0_g2_i1.p2 TRINITY_DN8064_c0_g2~~TRINITY_DN8064_c0_g2_i1.p2  ORF type:complete len:101 (+),score=5.24 TRINITY_DN8064_c0_g2_i1:698-1000(+)
MLADVVAKSKSLKWLNIAGTNGGNDGCRAFGEALKANKTLRVLNLCRLVVIFISWREDRRNWLLFHFRGRSQKHLLKELRTGKQQDWSSGMQGHLQGGYS